MNTAPQSPAPPEAVRLLTEIRAELREIRAVLIEIRDRPNLWARIVAWILRR